METVKYSPAFLRKRKMMIILPLLALPFVTMVFWALGGGGASAINVKQTSIEKGLNLQVPNAHLKSDKDLDKMSYYELAEADSAKLKERMRSDPYFKLKGSVSGETIAETEEAPPIDSSDGVVQEGLKVSPYNNNGKVNANEKQVYDKLRQINAALDNAKAASPLSAEANGNQHKYTGDDLSKDLNGKQPAVSNQNVDRLEKMMQSIKEPAEGSDSEMTQINAMLEKVMDIQHPERLNEKYRQNSAIQKKGSVYAVTANNHNNTGFYSESNSIDADTLTTNNQCFNAIEAIVHETQTLVNGGTVKLRLLGDVTINGNLVPKDNFIYGTVSLAGERLIVTINSVRYQNGLLPVALSVYDMDGQAGIYIPGAITRDVAKQSTDNALQSVALNSLDPSIGAQAATAGIETAKTLISKKVKLIRVTVKAGYHVLLKDNNNKQ